MSRRFVALLAAIAPLVVARAAHAEPPPSIDATDMPAEEPAERADDWRSRTGFHLKLDAGWGHRNVFDLAINGAQFSAAIGGDWHHLGLYGTGSYFRGATTEGLVTTAWDAGIALEAIYDRIRFGGGVRVSYVAFTPATGGRVIDQGGIGCFASFGVDLVKSRRGALYFDARYGIDSMGDLVHGPTLALGYRF